MPKPFYRLAGAIRHEFFAGRQRKPYYIFESEVYGTVLIHMDDFWGFTPYELAHYGEEALS